MRWIIAAIAIILVSPTSWACTCLKDDPPKAAAVKRYVKSLLYEYANVVRVRTTDSLSPTKDMREFIVIESWKGAYKVGELLKVRSAEVTSCDVEVLLGDELLVAFDSPETANFTKQMCEGTYAQERAALERKYLRKLLRRSRPTQVNSQ